MGQSALVPPLSFLVPVSFHFLFCFCSFTFSSMPSTCSHCQGLLKITSSTEKKNPVLIFHFSFQLVYKAKKMHSGVQSRLDTVAEEEKEKKKEKKKRKGAE